MKFVKTEKSVQNLIANTANQIYYSPILNVRRTLYIVPYMRDCTVDATLTHHVILFSCRYGPCHCRWYTKDHGRIKLQFISIYLELRDWRLLSLFFSTDSVFFRYSKSLVSSSLLFETRHAQSRYKTLICQLHHAVGSGKRNLCI